jgi:hypothetical protein
LRAARVLLPALSALRGGLAAAPALARRLARADAVAAGEAGREAQLHRAFRLLPRRLAAAPLTRRLDSNDAHLGGWLRCDPAYVRPDMSTARLLAWGEGLQLEAAEAEALVASLRVLFGDFNAPLSAPHPARWYVAVAEPRALPPMHAPEAVLGGDLLAFLPEGSEGRRWRQLWNEAQVILHQHPLNAARAAAGRPPVNSLWFWGGGQLPDSVQSQARGVLSVDPVVQALGLLAGCATLSADDPWHADALIDLASLRDVAELERSLLGEIEAALASARLDAVQLDFADGRGFALAHRQHWRFWRRPLADWSA